MDLRPQFKKEYADIIRLFIADRVKSAGAKGVVLGLSGGLDSAVVAKLCAESLGEDKVLALILPEKDSNPREVGDARELAGSIGIRHETIDITKSLEVISSATKCDKDRLALGNLKARCRMIILYQYANSQDRLVAGTGNKSELLVGYFTKYGDGGSDLLPLGDLYKTQVYELAKSIGIPEKIVQKVPTAGLWKGQTDEGELGMSYAELDRILHGFELGLSLESISERTGMRLAEVERVHALMRASEHKRKTPYIPKLGARTLGIDWRE